MKKFYLLTKTLLVATLLMLGASNAWGATETLSGDDATSKTDVGIAKTSFTMLGAYNPTGKTDINTKSCLKVRWQVSNASTGNTNGFALKVNTGYKITGVTAQMSGNGGTVTLKDIKVDGTSYSGEYSKTLNASNASDTKYTNITLSDINAQEYINFEIADGSAKIQGYVYVTVTYEEVKDVIYTKSLSGWTSSDVTKTEGTLDKWYNSTGIVASDYLTGMMIDATYGLRLAARNTTATATLKNSHTANSIVTIDAVWNVGSASSDSNTPNNKFQFGDLLIQQNVRSNNLTTTYKINGTTKTVGTDKFARLDDMTIHLKVNSYTGNILEFSLKNGETEVASFSDLTSTTNHFAAGSKYDEVTMTSWMSGSSAYTWCALKSITISEQEQAVYSYTVKGKAGNSTLKTITTGENLSGTTIFYHYNQCLNVNGTLYKASTDDTGAAGSSYKSKFVLESNNQEVVKAYSQPATPITNLVFLAEGEDIFTRGTGSSADVRLSMGAGGYAGSKTAFVTLPAGTYYLVLTNRCSGDKTGEHKFYKGEDESPFFSADGNGYNAERASGAFTLSGTTTLYMQGGDGNNLIDWLYIYGTPSNEIVGAVDYSTGYLDDMTNKVTLSPGESYRYKFVNYNSGSTSQWLNYVVPVYTSADVKTLVIRSDNWEDVKGTDAGCTNNFIWGDDNATFIAEMNGATIDMTISYSESNVLTMNAAIKTKSDYDWTYSYRTDYSGSGISLAGNIKVALSVSNSWLEVLSEGKIATIGATGWTTFSSSSVLDLSNMTASTGDVAAYYASSTSGESVRVETTESSAVQAGEGLLLRGTAGATITIPVATSAGTAISGNMLVGCPTAITISNETANYGSIYVLGIKSGTTDIAEFQNVKNYIDNAGGAPRTVSIPAGKAYLDATITNPARGLRIVFGDEITGVANVEAAAEAKVQDGKFFKDGKLFIMKNGVKYNAAGAQIK